MNLFELTRKLIDIPSVTGDEKAVGEFLKEHLETRGYQVEMQEVEADRFNIIATTGHLPRVVFSTHMDTVPPFIVSSEDETRIFGRGACDAKGIIAAQIVAAEQLRSEGIGQIGLLFTVDEEMGSLGAQIANDHQAAHETMFLINGEPTDNRLAAATKGSLRVALKSRGRAAHSAYPEQGESAIEKLLDVLSDIRSCMWPADELLGETTCNIGSINGGTRPNVIPEAAEAVLQFRLVSEAAPCAPASGTINRRSCGDRVPIGTRTYSLAYPGWFRAVHSAIYHRHSVPFKLGQGPVARAWIHPEGAYRK